MNGTRGYLIRRHIANRIKYARLQLGQTQETLGDQLTAYTSETWSRAVVANLEIGKRGITIEDLCAIAAVQGRPVTWYFDDAPASLAEAIPGWLLQMRYRGGDGPSFLKLTA
jgi:transcriptional regulator with XRE-family HTH domain